MLDIRLRGTPTHTLLIEFNTKIKKFNTVNNTLFAYIRNRDYFKMFQSCVLASIVVFLYITIVACLPLDRSSKTSERRMISTRWMLSAYLNLRVASSSSSIVCLGYVSAFLMPLANQMVNYVSYVFSQSHCLECNYRPAPCFSCNNRVLLGHSDEHAKTECPMRMVPCEYCGKQFKAAELVVSVCFPNTCAEFNYLIYY